MSPDRLDVMKGSLTLFVLRAVGDGPRHGHAIMRWIGERTDGAFQIEEGAVYPTLHRLRSKGLIDAEWGLSENNRKAKYYRLTARGRARLESETERWTRYVEAVSRVIQPT